jgi:hypothetical protein
LASPEKTAFVQHGNPPFPSYDNDLLNRQNTPPIAPGCPPARFAPFGRVVTAKERLATVERQSGGYLLPPATPILQANASNFCIIERISPISPGIPSSALAGGAGALGRSISA